MNSLELSSLLGKLIKHTRAARMDQSGLATRIGCSAQTVSRMERGEQVHSSTLFEALSVLGLIDEFIALTDTKLRLVASKPVRKRRADTKDDLSNDF